MKVSVILTSFNRPTWVRDSLRSIHAQTHRDLELIVIDESDEFDIHPVVEDFHFKIPVVVRHTVTTPEQKRLENRLGINCNLGLSLATGDLVTFLADDDYYYPTWLAGAVTYFQRHQHVQVGFGKLVYTTKTEIHYPLSPAPTNVRFYGHVVKDPFGKLDHNQVIHRKFNPAFAWPTGAATIGGPDAYYFREITQKHEFHPIPALAAVKRLHKKGLMESQQIYLGGAMEGLRE
jgi:spore maturation protein CgeD